MAGPFSVMTKIFGGSAVGIAKRPPLLGAAIGGIHGAFRGDSTGDRRLENIARGALGGAALGAGAKFAFKNASSIAREGAGLAKGATKGLGRGAEWVVSNPLLAAGAGIGGAAFLGSDRSPASSQGIMANVNYNAQAAAANEMRRGNVPQSTFIGNAAEHSAYSAAQNRMKQSTMGLVQGLSRGRHS